MKILESIDEIEETYWLIIAFTMIGGIAILDYLSGNSLEFAEFYLIPITLLTWRIGRSAGIMTIIISAFVWNFSRILSGQTYPQPVYYIVNTLIEFFPATVVVILLSEIKIVLENEKALTQIDYLTGAVNSRAFYTILQTEIRRSNRYNHPFTIAYFDLDNFKQVNDLFGHNTGDEVLRAVVKNAQKHLRKTDVIARLGGDEFAILLPEADHEAAQGALPKLRNDIIEAMRQNNWEITISMGVLICSSCIESPIESDEIIRLVDNLMYSVKQNGKNAITYSIYENKQLEPPPEA